MTRFGDTAATAVRCAPRRCGRSAPWSRTSRSFGLNIENSSGPASTSITRAWSAVMPWVVLREVRPVQLGQRPRRLHAGRPAADDDDVERAVLDQRRVAVDWPPSARSRDPSAAPRGASCTSERVLVGALGAEEVHLGAEAVDEVVVRDRREAVEARPGGRPGRCRSHPPGARSCSPGGRPGLAANGRSPSSRPGRSPAGRAAAGRCGSRGGRPAPRRRRAFSSSLAAPTPPKPPPRISTRGRWRCSARFPRHRPGTVRAIRGRVFIRNG